MTRLEKAEVLARLDKVAWWTSQGLRIAGNGSGGRLKAHCPKHDDSSPSASFDPETGYVRCFSACNEGWGPIDWLMKQHGMGFVDALRSLDGGQSQVATLRTPALALAAADRTRVALPKEPRPVLEDLEALQLLRDDYSRNLADGVEGRRYLESRHIPLDVALGVGVGCVEPDSLDDWNCLGSRQLPTGMGCIVFPHTDPAGRVINFNARGTKDLKDGAGKWVAHLRRADREPCRGLFNAQAIKCHDGPLFICEGPFDAISLIAGGVPRAVAMFGLDFSSFFHWIDGVRTVVLALDNDEPGRKAAFELARALHLQGKDVEILDGSAYGGCKDINEAWVAGVLRLPTPSVQDGSAPAQQTVQSEARSPAPTAADCVDSDAPTPQRDPIVAQLHSLLAPYRTGVIEMRLSSRVPKRDRERWMICGELAAKWWPTGQGGPPTGLEGALAKFMSIGPGAVSAYRAVRREWDEEPSPSDPRELPIKPDAMLAQTVVASGVSLADEVQRLIERLARQPHSAKAHEILRFLTVSRAEGLYQFKVVSPFTPAPPDDCPWSVRGDLAWRWWPRELEEPPGELAEILEFALANLADEIRGIVAARPTGWTHRFFTWNEDAQTLESPMRARPSTP